MAPKECGHDYCSLVNKEGCCACLDQRPYSKSYSHYIDGRGNVNIPDLKERCRGYCPECRDAIAGPLPLYWKLDIGKGKHLVPENRNKMSRRDRRAAHRQMMSKEANTTMDSVDTNRALLHYNHNYRQETNLNATKMAVVRESQLSAASVSSPERKAVLPHIRQKSTEKSTDLSSSTEPKPFIPSPSSSDIEPHNPFSITRNTSKFRFPSWSLPSFHHKKPELALPSSRVSTSTAEPPPYDSSGTPDSAPPPYTPFDSDGRRIVTRRGDEKTGG